jgi:hypothetical protein
MLNILFENTPSPEAVEAAKETFAVAVTRELLIRGIAPGTIIALTAGMPDHVRSHTAVGARYETRDGRMLTAAAAAADLLAEAAERARVAAFGPDAETILVARLTSLDVPIAEARARAEGRVRRLDDGRVAAYDRSGSTVYAGGFEMDPARTYSPAEAANFHDASEAVTRACRMILDEHERGLPLHDVPPAVQNPAAGAF